MSIFVKTVDFCDHLCYDKIIQQKGIDLMFKRILIYIISVAMAWAGIGMLLFLDLGLDPFASFIMGVSNITGLSFGTTMLLGQGVFIIPVFWKKRDAIGIGTVIALLLGGYVIEFFANLWYLIFPAELFLAWRIGLLFVALIFFAFALAALLFADFGIAVYEGLGLAIEEMTNGKFKFKYNRITTDAIATALGFLFGATVGIATVATVFLVGPLVDFFKRKLEKVL